MERFFAVILGCGNELAGDDGIGVYVARRLKQVLHVQDDASMPARVLSSSSSGDIPSDVPSDVLVVEAGCSGLDLIDHVIQAEKAIIIDAVKANAPPGTIHRVDAADLFSEEYSQVFRCTSLHDIGVKDALALAHAIYPGSLPRDIIIIGVEVASTFIGATKLSPPVKAAVPRVMSLVLREIGRHGLEESCEDADA